MKITISIDDRLLRESDQAARLLGISRSRLFARAMDHFLQRQRLEQMLMLLNKVYAEGTRSNEERLLHGMKTRVRRTVKDRW
jgi:metal-responsive CopG/Arc/MetJ family transcriptional regulator